MSPTQEREIQRQIQRSRKALNEARGQVARLRHEIRESQREAEKARRALREVGWL